ncbi:MAG: hypothetical protein DI561_04600 [Thauera sp.]|nr:MAG: hypothetical protein DI561_04600 [Thauera sp.]
MAPETHSAAGDEDSVFESHHTERQQWASQEYERQKAEWVARHPGAEAEEYATAIREIARKVGL